MFLNRSIVVTTLHSTYLKILFPTGRATIIQKRALNSTHCTMADRSFFIKFLLCLLIFAVVIRQLEINAVLKQLGIKHISRENISVNASTTMKREKENVTQGLEKLMKPCLIIFWSTYFGRKKLDEEYVWKNGECPMPVEVTINRTREREANAFVVHARDPHVIPPTHSVPWILLTQENPVYTPVLSDANFMSKFNLLRSYRLDSDFPDPTFRMPDLTPPVPFKEKTGLIFAAFSNCEPVRTEYMRQLMKFVQVDSYGGCLRNKNELVGRYGAANGKNFKQLKTEMAWKYKFTLVFFNQDCDYFVDDQLSHALSAGSVPVVMSTDKLDEFLPGNLRNSVIKVCDFKNPSLLAKHLKFLSNNETEYNKYLEWKWKGFGDYTGTVIGNHWKPKYSIYCQICVALSEGRIHRDGLKTITCKGRAYEDWGITPGA